MRQTPAAARNMRFSMFKGALLVAGIGIVDMFRLTPCPPAGQSGEIAE